LGGSAARSVTFPGPCIWCGDRDIESDKSHIVPAAVGNDLQALPPGIVCRQCNGFFGTKIEPTLLADPFLHTVAVVLRLQNVRKSGAFRDEIFDAEHPAVDGVRWNVDVRGYFRDNALSFTVTQSMEGTMEVSYDRRRLALLSRAVHKIAFENLAYSWHTKQGLPAELDPWIARYDAVRAWVRRGEPHNRIRAVVRWPTPHVTRDWATEIWRHEAEVLSQLNLFGEWYAVSLTSSPADARAHLESLVAGGAGVWLFEDAISAVGDWSETRPPTGNQ
jgi:hypothetical protein